MIEALKRLLDGRLLLLGVAAEAEAKAVIEGLGGGRVPEAWQTNNEGWKDVEVLLTGVGKANAAGAVARTLDASRHGCVLSVGVAGSYGVLELGSCIAASDCVFADEGVQTSAGFRDMAALGFPPGSHGMSAPVSGAVLEAIRGAAGAVGVISTVSTCSGTDELAREIVARTGAVAEAMEGAAVVHAAWRVGVPAGELRVISNTTGDRSKQRWDLPRALEELSAVVQRLCG